MARRRRQLTGEEEQLWRLATRDVRPLPGLPPASPPPPDALVSAPKPGRVLKRQQPAVPPASAPSITPSGPAPLLDSAPNRQWDRKLKRGDMEIDARIDLHGQTELQAYRRLSRFIIEAAAVDARRLLVITGKGRAGRGLLKTRVPDWLSGGDLRPLVMAVHPAHVRDGGDGAYYVILRRRRP